LSFQTFPNEDVPRGSYITFGWEAETQEGNYLHRLPVQALVAASGRHMAAMLTLTVPRSTLGVPTAVLFAVLV